VTPLVLGLAGPRLTDAERSLFQSLDPAGFILFARNIESLEQVRALTESLRSLSGRSELSILIDQEGGRVARLKPPLVPAFPPAAVFGAAWEKAPATAMAAARANAEAIGVMLASLGISVDCLPLLDVPQEGAHDVIGDRAFARDPLAVAALGRASLDGLQRAGVVGVVKHVPGHGRAGADSHLDLPVIPASADELETDLAPFRSLADAPMAMTAHILYPAWDGELCATLSSTIIRDIIRGGIGFDGLLISDDLGMHALAHQPGAGDMGRRAALSLAAGCDIALHCSGNMAEMEAIAAEVPQIGAEAVARLERAMAWRRRARVPREGEADSIEALIARRDALLEAAG
jgi:beta-N-acetylhexosaminidase